MSCWIPHSRPFVGHAEKQALSRVVDSGQLAQGGEVEGLENELARAVNRRFGVAVSSGTAALYLALRALGVGRGHRVVIPSYVCTALLNAVYQAGAEPVLADVDPATGNLTVDTVKKVLRRGTRAVIVPHLFGAPADAGAVEQLGVPVIEDCAQCLGTRKGRRKVGGLTTVSVFSFYATKLIAAGEGGMIATNDRSLASKAGEMRAYDKRDTYTHGFNYKLSDLHASVARVQLRRLATMVEKRRAVARRYAGFLEDNVHVLAPAPERSTTSVFYRYVVRVKAGVDGLVEGMAHAGAECARPVYRPLHRYLGQKGFAGTEEIHRTALSLPVYPGLTMKAVDGVGKRLAHLLERRSP